MSLGDLSRINTNIQSMQALGQLNQTNSELGIRQLRLATGSRLNRAEDDSAGYSIANKLQAKTRGQAQALSNIGDAKGMLTVGEGALNTTMDILQTMKEKAVQAANDTMGDSERTAIQNQLDALTKEIGDTLGSAEFNGTKLFAGEDEDGTTALSLNFQVGAGSADSFGVNIAAQDVETLGVGDIADADVAAATAAGGDEAANIANAAYNGTSTTDISQNYRIVANGGNHDLEKSDADGNWSVVEASITDGQTITDGDFEFDVTTAATVGTFSIDYTAAVSEGDFSSTLDVSDATNAQSAIDTIDAAIATVNSAVSGLGDSQARLSIKQDNLDTSMTNYEAARSRIEDTDFAKEQMEIVKLQILQQTGISSLAQANAGPQSVLSLLG